MGNSRRDPRVESFDERQLVERARGGDRAAFAELVRRHQDEVYTLARRLVNDPHLAADVSQEAMVKAWRALARFRGDSAFGTWLHRITVNTAWTMRRKALRGRGLALEEIDEPAVPLGPEDPYLARELAELRGDLRRALASLPDGSRQVVVLKDVYGWSHDEIADSMGITVTAAKVRLHRARARLARLLGAIA